MLVLGFGFVQALPSNRRRRQSDTSPALRCLFFTPARITRRVRLVQSQKAEKAGKNILVVPMRCHAKICVLFSYTDALHVLNVPDRYGLAYIQWCMTRDR